MTQTFTTNAVNDIFIGNNGNLSISSGIDGVLQACASAARTILGECVLQTDIGLPNFQTIWIGVPNVVQWESALKQTLQAVEGVNTILSITTSRATEGTLSYTALIETIYGQGVLSG